MVLLYLAMIIVSGAVGVLFVVGCHKILGPDAGGEPRTGGEVAARDLATSD